MLFLTGVPVITVTLVSLTYEFDRIITPGTPQSHTLSVTEPNLGTNQVKSPPTPLVSITSSSPPSAHPTYRVNLLNRYVRLAPTPSAEQSTAICAVYRATKPMELR